MSEFTDKVNQYKQDILDQNIIAEGFRIDDDAEENTPRDNSPPINNIEDTSSDDSQNNESTEEQKEHKKTTRGITSLKKKLEEVKFERKVAEAQKLELLARVQEQERRLAEQQSLLEQNEQYKNAYYENNLDTRENAIINELRVAKEEGDIEKEISLTKELSKISADKSTYGLYKSQLRNQPPPPQPQYNNYQNQYPQPDYRNQVNDYDDQTDDVYDLWLERNSWADPDSKNFSPRLREEANEFANDLNERLRFSGRADIIGSEAYYRTIDNIMSQQYGPAQKEQSEQRESPSYNVAPVSRNGSLMSDQYIGKNTNNTRDHFSLTENEYKIARNLKVPTPDGNFLSEKQAMELYYESKKDLKKNFDPDKPNRIIIE